jgi:MFS family permease
MTETAASTSVSPSVHSPNAHSPNAHSPNAQPEVAALPPLRRNKQFQTLWAGSAAAALGISVADVAYPLAILGVTGSPADAGLFAAVQAVGMIVAGLPAGQLVDKRSPRVVLIVAESCRALVTGVIAAALIMGWLSLPLLLAAAVLIGACQPMTSAARMLLIRTVVPKEQLTRALTQDEVRINGADLAGPPLGGALYGLQALAHAVPFLFTIGSFVLSLISGFAVRAEPDRTPSSPAGDAGHGDLSNGVLAGITAIWASPVLRATTALLATVNAIGAGLGLIAVVILRDQSVSPAMIGLALGGGAVGGLAGAPLVRPLHRLRPGVLLIAVCCLFVPLIALLAVPYGPWWMAALLFVTMLGVPSIRVLVDVLVLRQAPADQRGRIVAAVMTLLAIGMPAGLAASGLLLQYLPAQTTVLILAGLLAIGVLITAVKPQVWQARWPD